MLLRNNIYRAIRRSILNCDYRPGQELREQVLAEYFHVSRSPVRDSLLRLEQEHLVTVLPRQGYRVNPITIDDVQDIFGLRLVIDPACAALAARRDNAAVRTLDEFRCDPWASAIGDRFIDNNRVFHSAVAQLSNNSRMAAVACDLVEHFDRLVRISLNLHKKAQVAKVTEEHNAIIDAIQAHDADRAARLAFEHAEGGRVRIIAALRQISASGEEAVDWRMESRDAVA